MRKPPAQPPSSEITPESLYLGRREFIKNGVLLAGTAAAVGTGLLWLVGAGPPPDAPEEQPSVQPAASTAAGPYDTDEPPTAYQSVTTYNNYYEFGLHRADPAQNAHTLQTRPCTVRGEGTASQPASSDI